jgi:hypothetical protein
LFVTGAQLPGGRQGRVGYLNSMSIVFGRAMTRVTLAVDHPAIGKIGSAFGLALGPDRLHDKLDQRDRRHARDTTGVRFSALKEDLGE